MAAKLKIPRSVLVVIYTADLQVLMLERAGWPGFWQSVTGSIDHEDEPLAETAAREVREETGIDVSHYRLEDWGIENSFEIFEQYRSRYAEGVTHNLRAYIRPGTARRVAGTAGADRTPALRMAAVERSCRAHAVLDQSRRHPAAAAKARRSAVGHAAC